MTVVIVGYNTRELLLDCLRSIYDQTRGVTFDVIVVDNASRDGSVAAVARAFPQVRLIANGQNRGFAAANNQGLRIARGRYILLLNPDTVILDNAIAGMVAFADRHPEAAVVGCQVLEDERTIQRTCFSFPSVLGLLLTGLRLNRLFPRSRFFGRPDLAWWDRNSPREVDVVSGMFFLVRREAMDQVGLLDEDYFVYAEETDWCYRFRKAGWHCLFAPEARIIHRDGGNKSTDQVPVRMYVQLQKSLLIFYRKHRGWSSFVLAKAIYILMMAVRTLIWGTCAALRVGTDPRPRLARAVAALQYHLVGKEPRP